MLTLSKIHEFFNNFGFVRGVECKPIATKRYLLVLETAKRWHGRELSQFLLGCFAGVEQNKDGTYSMYKLDYPNDTDLMKFLYSLWLA